MGAALHRPDLITWPVRWQRAIAGDSSKISTFTAEVGSLLTFQSFLMMREGSAMVTIVHSIAKFFSLSAATFHYQGKYIGFVGNRLVHANRDQSSSRQPRAGTGSRKQSKATVRNYFRHTRVAWNMARCGPPQ